MLNSNNRIVIHVGYHKSASTYLQNIFSAIDVNFAILNRNQLDSIESAEFVPAEFIESIQYKNKQNIKEIHTAILSNEELSGHPHGSPDIDPFLTARNIHDAFPDANILFIIRNQLDYMLSLYAFRVAVKGEECRGLKKFLREDGRNGLFDKLEYDKLIHYYRELFGEEKVVVLPMEMLKEHGDDFHAKIRELIHCDYDVPSVSRGKVNASTKKALIIFFWRIGNFVFSCLWAPMRRLLASRDEMRLRYRFYRLKQGSTRAVAGYFSGCQNIRIPDEIVSESQKRFSGSNERLSKMIRIKLDEYGYL